MKKSSFKVNKLYLDGAFLIEPFVSTDERGGFVKDYSKELLSKAEINYDLAEVFYTYSKAGVIRALHFQEYNHQPKLVRCVKGKVYDIIVDLRKESPTYKKYFGIYLSEDNCYELLVPAHFGHGYLVIENSIVSYKCSTPFDGPNDSGIKFDDEDLKLPWPFDDLGNKPLIISEKDKKLQSLKEYEERGNP